MFCFHKQFYLEIKYTHAIGWLTKLNSVPLSLDFRLTLYRI